VGDLVASAPAASPEASRRPTTQASATATEETALSPATATPALPPPDDATSPPASTEETPRLACDDRAAFVDDITIRDYTVLPAGEAFIKTWRLQNVGTCSWSEEYALVFFGGERMGAPDSLPLNYHVLSGETIDLSIDLVAPLEPGTHQGFWRLSDPDGVLFGIGANGSESFWVRIVVEMPLPTSPATPSPTAPPVHAMGTFQLTPGDSADLDMGALNPSAGADLALNSGALGAIELAPQSEALLGAGSPEGISDPSACLAASLSSTPLPVTSLSPGASLCYLTSEGRPGLLVVNSRNDTLAFSYTTWTP
jgi:hypothetical protein